MEIEEIGLPGVFLLRETHDAPPGHWPEAVSKRLRLPENWAQNRFEVARLNVVRGIHYQVFHPQGRLVGVTQGRALHVAVDLRRSSSWFGLYSAQVLSAEGGEMLWIPEGFGHAWMALTPCVGVVCRATASDFRELHRTIVWNDPDLAIPWPADAHTAILSEEDRQGCPLRRAEVFP